MYVKEKRIGFEKLVCAEVLTVSSTMPVMRMLWEQCVWYDKEEGRCDEQEQIPTYLPNTYAGSTALLKQGPSFPVPLSLQFKANRSRLNNLKQYTGNKIAPKQHAFLSQSSGGMKSMVWVQP